MQTTNNRHSFKLGLVVVALAILLWGVPVNVSASDGTAVLLTGITFDSSVDDTDITFFKASLQLLADRLPVWYEYLEQAKPLFLSVDATRIAVGTVAFAECCDAQGAGAITFGYRFGTTAVSSEPKEQSMQTRQVAFLGYFIHEVTHIRDQRAGRIPKKIDATVCVIGEKAALAQVLDFKRVVASTRIADDPMADQVYRLAAQDQVNAEANNLDNEQYWDRYCGFDAPPKTTHGTDYALARINP